MEDHRQAGFASAQYHDTQNIAGYGLHYVFGQLTAVGAYLSPLLCLVGTLIFDNFVVAAPAVVTFGADRDTRVTQGTTGRQGNSQHTPTLADNDITIYRYALAGLNGRQSRPFYNAPHLDYTRVAVTPKGYNLFFFCFGKS